ncbi:MAG: GNAT family N-acetyltransferase [Actinomycetia bacterium]|nr:GNAT family N-acetyltransferase [Actinomycetes bacterium]MCP4221824.1 GNAT family N-acetyltransferase [Actinomycetes bacterium]MCP5034305.1 GNAT family N-acetyltransferase [Actinomycetes bacterium]
MDLTIRDATDTDRISIAELHSASWMSAYASILPAHFLEGVEERHRRQWATLPSSGFVLIGEQAGETVGFGAVLEPDPGSGELLLDNLHVAPKTRSSGVGSRLLTAVFERARSTTSNRLYLWVLEDNVGARRFYRRHGGIETVTRVEDLDPRTEAEERRVEWWLPLR